MKIIWMTGQPGAGKTTIANEFRSIHPEWFHIDGDDIRELFANKDYSESGRRSNVMLAQQLSEFLYRKGKSVIVSLVSPYIDQREDFKGRMGPDLIEVYVHTSEERGREKFWVDDYAKPIQNFIEIDTTGLSPQESYEKLMRYVEI